MARLRGGLVDAEGEVGYTMAFGTDALGVAFVELRVEPACRWNASAACVGSCCRCSCRNASA